MIQHDIDIISLGCSKNLVDTERLMKRLETVGWTCHFDPEVPTSPVLVINTCGFIGDAKEESINTILVNALRKKAKKNRLEKLYVMGCLSERYKKDLIEEIPEVDGWFGKFDYEGIIDKLDHPKSTGNARQYLDNTAGPMRTLTTPAHYAYFKISEGCNRMCSYCAIPLITGRHTSRPMEELIREAEWLRDQGVQELNVIAQDLSSYGLDLYKEHKLPELVERLANIDGIRWIRLHYAYPTDFPDELLDVMAKHDNVCKYLDIALQHCTTHMLQKMRRHINREEQDALIRRIRERVPGICLRTTLMVGHPGETEQDFEELKQWVREMRFDRLGAFAYSDEEGTYASRHYADDIPDEVKQRRLSELMAIQQDISAELMAQKVGQKMQVVIDRKEGNIYIGRTEFDSPEVDCEVLIENDNELQIGKFYTILITKAEEFDLYGKVC